jgi:hypothetical protein
VSEAVDTARKLLEKRLREIDDERQAIQAALKGLDRKPPGRRRKRS